MKRIFRYEIPVTDFPTIEIPENSQFLSFGVGARGELAVWFIVDEDQHCRGIKFRLYGTGHPVNCTPNGWSGQFLGTAVTPPFVWHLFCESVMEHKHGYLFIPAWHIPTCDS